MPLYPSNEWAAGASSFGGCERAKRWFDAVGRYSRTDVLKPTA